MLWNKRAVTDAALLLVLAAERDFRFARQNTQRRPRIVSFALGTLDPIDVTCQATILRLFSTIEAYVDALNRDLLQEAIDLATPQPHVVLEELQFHSSRNWSERQKAFRRVHGVRLSRQCSWKEIEATREVRNCIAHGLGQLTAPQLRNQNIGRKLEFIKIRVSGGRLVITDESVWAVVQACSKFIRSVDRAI